GASGPRSVRIRNLDAILLQHDALRQCSIDGTGRALSMTSEAVRYRISMPRPHTHLFEVEATFPPLDHLEAVLPVWTPGSYLVRAQPRHAQDVSAVDALGSALAVERTDKRTWRVAADGRAVTLRYRVYANELTVRTSHLDGSHGYFNGATVFLYTERLRAVPH